MIQDYGNPGDDNINPRIQTSKAVNTVEKLFIPQSYGLPRYHCWTFLCMYCCTIPTEILPGNVNAAVSTDFLILCCVVIPRSPQNQQVNLKQLKLRAMGDRLKNEKPFSSFVFLVGG